jgi:hypothetical protein
LYRSFPTNKSQNQAFADGHVRSASASSSHAAHTPYCSVLGVSPLKMALAAGWNSFAYSVQQLLQPPRAPMSASSSPQVLPQSSQSTLSSVHRSQTPAIPPTFQSNLESLKPQAHVEVRAACSMLLAPVTFVIAETASFSNNRFYSGGGSNNNNSSYTTHST